MTGSLRQRGSDSWELRVYLGVDPERGRERWASKTVHGTRRHATACLAQFVEEAGYARLRAGTVADLLDRWLAHASVAWSASTLRQTRSIVERPHDARNRDAGPRHAGEQPPLAGSREAGAAGVTLPPATGS